MEYVTHVEGNIPIEKKKGGKCRSDERGARWGEFY